MSLCKRNNKKRKLESKIEKGLNILIEGVDRNVENLLIDLVFLFIFVIFLNLKKCNFTKKTN